MSLFTSYPHSTRKTKQTTGFTIVELLIVIVVIAILAAISIVAYNGIQERANNVKTIAAAKQVVNLTQAYYAAYDSFPVLSGCATLDNKCTNSSAVSRSDSNTELMAELNKVGTPPGSATAKTSAGTFGIQYLYANSGPFTQLYPIRIEYYLQGGAQDCGLGNIANSSISGFSSTKYSRDNGTWTSCWAMIAK